MNSATATFDQFQLSPAMRTALQAVGYHTPTPIQERAIAPALAGHDIIGSAQTGTGKTAAFVIPIVERLRATPGGNALILAPTRELAEQTFGWTQRLGCGLRTVLVVGGVAYGPQIHGLRNRPDIIVATPGRLVDHLERGTLALPRVSILVLDEGDRMLDMGFKPQLDRIMHALPAARQTMLFSATMASDVTALARMHLREPVRVQAGPQAVTPTRAAQDVYIVAHEDKTPLLLSLVRQDLDDGGSVLVFTRTKHRTDRIAHTLQNAGHKAARLHSNRSQSQRREALDGFRSGRYRILVATDIAARGIDVVGIRRVINYDLPQTVEDYVHRIGRTARATADGHASSFAAPQERGQLHAIERHIGRALQRQSHAPSHAASGAAGHGEPAQRPPRPALAARYARRFDNEPRRHRARQS